MSATSDFPLAQSVIFIVAAILVTGCTAARLLIERKKGVKWRHDNNLVLAALLCQVGGLVLSIEGLASRRTKVKTYYLSIAVTLAELWLSRLSHIWSYGRGTHGKHGSFAAFFLILWIALTSQIFWICEQPPVISWKSICPLQCPLGITTALTQGLLNILADVVLIYFSMKMLREFSMQTRERRCLKIVALTPTFTATLSAAHSVSIVVKDGRYERILAHLLSWTAIIVCNSQFLVPWLLKIRSPYELAEPRLARRPVGRTNGELERISQ